MINKALPVKAYQASENGFKNMNHAYGVVQYSQACSSRMNQNIADLFTVADLKGL